ncbi:MAG: hypothetical protein R3C11_06400 [Planctomycetaceae bacterium]
MKRFNKNQYRFLLASAVAGMIGLCTAAQADEGVARIADANYSGEPQLLSFQGSSVEYGGYVEGGCPNCNPYGGCDSGCEKDGWCNKYPADAGWGRPIRNYITNTPVQYLKRWPDATHGITPEAAMQRYPMVYMPSDTTQLGFTYQRVPSWQPKPWMLPPMPWPNQWHQREYGYKTPYWGAPCQGVVYSDVTYESPTPVESTTEQAPTVVPPVPEVRHSMPKPLKQVGYTPSR